MAWFAAAHLLTQTGRTGWEQVGKHDVQQWVVWLLDRYSAAYASNQFRALQQFFKWLAAEEDIPDPMAGLRQLHVPDRPVPVFADGDLARLEHACAGRSFQQRRDAAMIAVFAATGVRLAELAGIRYEPGDPRRSDVDLWHREITVHGKGRTTRTVKISYDAARALDRYIRARARHAQACRPQLWLGVNNRGPMTASGIYQVIARRGRQCGVEVFPHRFRHHFSHTWLDRGGAEGDLMELNGWTPRRCCAATAPAPAAPEPAAATTASWPTHPDLNPPGLSLRRTCSASTSYPGEISTAIPARNRNPAAARAKRERRPSTRQAPCSHADVRASPMAALMHSHA